MKIVSKSVHDWTKAEKAACYRCSYGMMGGMQVSLSIIFAKKTPARAFMAFDDDGKLMGWILRGKVEDDWFIHSYVHEEYRGKGIGSSLLMRALNGLRNPARVYQGNYQSHRMYIKMQKRGRVQIMNAWWPDENRLRQWRF